MGPSTDHQMRNPVFGQYIKLSSLAAALLLTIAAAIAAQTPNTPQLDLATAVEKAVSGNPIAKAADTRVKIADLKVREMMTGRRPSIQFSQSAVGSNNPVFVFGSLLEQGRFGPSNFSIDSLNKPDGLLNLRSLVSAQMPIFDQHQTRSRVKQAETGRSQTVLMAEAARQQLRFEVIRTFYGVILSRSMVGVSKDAITTAEANRKKTKDLVDVGMTTDADLLSADVEVANAVQRRLEAESELVTTLAAMNLTIGEAADMDRELKGELREKFFPVEDRAELIRLALENRPDYQRALLDIENSRLQSRAVRDQRLPRVDAFGNFGYSSPYITNGSTDYTVGVNLTYTIFDAGRKARTEAAIEAEALAGHERDNLANQIRLDVIRAHEAFKTSGEKIRVTIKSIAQADEALRIVEDRYRFGRSTFNEVLRAGSALTRAKQDLLNTRYEYYINYARLLLATGRLDDVRWFD